MTVPDTLRDEVKTYLWAEADRLMWSALSASSKAKYYTIWTETAFVGGRLGAFMDPRQIRVYIKDTLLKPYTRERLSNPGPVLQALGLTLDAETVSYIKPHGRRLSDGRQIVWSKATDWKATLMALHERSFESGGTPYAAVFFEACTKHPDIQSREVVNDAAKKLEVKRVVWFD